jgi:hypothetical protein
MLGQLRQLDPLDLDDMERGLHRLTRQIGIRHGLLNVTCVSRVSPATAPVIRLPKSSNSRIPQAEYRLQWDAQRVRSAKGPVFVASNLQLERTRSSGSAGPCCSTVLPNLLQDLAQVLIDVRVGDLPNRILQRQTAPFGQLEVRPDLQIELERHRPLVRYFDGVQIDLRLADRRKLMLFAQLPKLSISNLPLTCW